MQPKLQITYMHCLCDFHRFKFFCNTTPVVKCAIKDMYLELCRLPVNYSCIGLLSCVRKINFIHHFMNYAKWVSKRTLENIGV